jgi:ABC-2 type transport system ATP-binding protein
MYALETLNLTKRYKRIPGLSELLTHPFRGRGSITALSDVTLKVGKGDLFGLLGPNGAGKTTLIKLLSTLILPDEGQAYINGLDVTGRAKEVKGIIGLVVADERSFYWRLTGRQNLSFFATLQNIPDATAMRKVDEVFSIVGLGDQADIRFMNYSAGMKQRLAIARALLNNPQVLLMDEPTRSLDPLSAHNLRGFIKEWMAAEEGRTVFMSTHNLNEAKELCSRIAIIDRASIKVAGTFDEIRKISGVRQKHVLSLRPYAGTFEMIGNILERRRFKWSYKKTSAGEIVFEFESEDSEDRMSGLLEEILATGGRVSSFYPEGDTTKDIFAHFIEEGHEVRGAV